MISKGILVQILASRYSVEDVCDAESLEDLPPGGVVVAAEVEEIREDLRGEGAGRLDRPLEGGGDAVAADSADLTLLVLVVVATDIAGVLPLPLPHRASDPSDSSEKDTSL